MTIGADVPSGILETLPGPRSIDARPTKQFFIDMLVRDIELLRAITDLVDNSVDGARRLRGHEPDANYLGLRVDLTISPQTFVIEDNCGGIDIALARGYAFRFGRGENAPETPHSVGAVLASA